MKKMMFGVIAPIMWSLLLVSCTQDNTINSKDELFLLVIDNIDTLEELVLFIDGFEEEIYIIDYIDNSDVTKNYLDFDNPLLTQIVSEFGIMHLRKIIESEFTQPCITFSIRHKLPNHYWGFYYVSDGNPVGWGGLIHYAPIEKEGLGYIIPKGTASVAYYTEEIMRNWYYFEANY